MKSLYTPLIAATMIGLGACGKPPEGAAETAVEKMIESRLGKGSTAEVDLSKGTVNLATTGASGQKLEGEYGLIKISEADLGISFYPGSKQDHDKSMRLSTSDEEMLSTLLQSTDSFEEVTAFYRSLLQEQSGKKRFAAAHYNGVNMFVKTHDVGGTSASVSIAKNGEGTLIHIDVTKRKPE